MGLDQIQLALYSRIYLVLIIIKGVVHARHVGCLLLLWLSLNYSIQKACFLNFTSDWALGRIC